MMEAVGKNLSDQVIYTHRYTRIEKWVTGFSSKSGADNVERKQRQEVQIQWGIERELEIQMRTKN